MEEGDGGRGGLDRIWREWVRRLDLEGEGIERSSAGSGRGEEEQRASERKEAGGGWKMTTGQS